MTSDCTIWDAVIIGGGPAGLQAALMLGRACRSVLVTDTGAPRNASARHSHGFLTRDGVPPAALLRVARADFAHYPNVHLRPIAATGATARPGGFRVTLASGEEVETRAILVAAGVRDQLPDLPGFKALWGTGVFSCPYCHGYELRGQPLAVYGQDAYALHMVTLIRAWTQDIALLTDGPVTLDADTQARLARQGVVIYDGVISALEGGEQGLERIRFADGATLARRGLLYKAQTVPGSEVPVQLGAELGPDGLPVLIAPFSQSTVPGLYIAGDMVSLAASVVFAAASGAMAAAGLNHALTQQDAEAAR